MDCGTRGSHGNLPAGFQCLHDALEMIEYSIVD